jgi:hypothetical protein
MKFSSVGAELVHVEGRKEGRKVGRKEGRTEGQTDVTG